MLRGRIVGARGVKAEDLKASTDSEWVLQSDRGLTYTGEVPKGSKIVEGEWWGASYDGPPLVSIEKKIADGLHLKLGDEVVVNVLGRDIPAKIGNMRSIDWQGLGINFVLVFSPNAFKGAPHTHIATLTEPHPSAAEDARIIKEVAASYPTVTSVRVREVMQTIGSVVTNLALAIRGASAVTLISAILVLGGALAAGRRHPEDARRNARAAARRLCAGISPDRACHRRVRRDRGLGRRLHDRDAADDVELRLGGRQRRCSGCFRVDRHRGPRACRHAARIEPEARDGVAQSMTNCSNRRWSGFHVCSFLPGIPGRTLRRRRFPRSL
jgi:hypothetical protein